MLIDHMFLEQKRRPAFLDDGAVFLVSRLADSVQQGVQETRHLMLRQECERHPETRLVDLVRAGHRQMHSQVRMPPAAEELDAFATGQRIVR